MNDSLINEIITKYDTPTYVFDINELVNRIKYLRENLPSKVHICYAIKANTFIVKDVEKYVDRFEVCSPGEYEICREQEIDYNKIFISGVNKTTASIKRVLDSSEVRLFSVESLNQYKLLKETNQKIKVILRLTHGNQFGVNEEDIIRIIKENENHSEIEIVGLQYFTGTQKTSIKKLKRELDYLDSFIEKIKNDLGFEFEELEFGTGFPVYYFEDNKFDEDDFMKQFSAIISNMNYKGKIVLEIGRSIVASCGYYLTRVIDVKTNSNENFAIVDGGINHITYYGQFMAMKIPKIDIWPKKKEAKEEKWNVCGSLCTINDILVKQFSTQTLDIGDVLVFNNVGAYSMTEGLSLFLSRDLPAILKINQDGSIKTIRKITPTYMLNM